MPTDLWVRRAALLRRSAGSAARSVRMGGGRPRRRSGVMTERMSSADVVFLHHESRNAPQHVGGLAVFASRPGGFEYDRLVRLLEERISLAPRYRQKVRMVPGHLAHPMWLDDRTF